jgi:hypothetical protein
MSTGLPYPTPTRLRLADSIAAGHVRYFHWHKPWACDTATDGNVSARVTELVRAGLAMIPNLGEHNPPNHTTVELTVAGRAWVERAKNRDNEAGPGSTSPEPGPPAGRTVLSDIELTAIRMNQRDAALLDALIDEIEAESGPATKDGAE